MPALAVFLLLILLSASGRDAVVPEAVAELARPVVEPTAAPQIVTVPMARAVAPVAAVNAVGEVAPAGEIFSVAQVASVGGAAPVVQVAPEADGGLVGEVAPLAAFPIRGTYPAEEASLPKGAITRTAEPTPSPTITFTIKPAPPPLDPPTFESFKRITTIRDFSSYTSHGRTRWVESVPGIKDLRIVSTADGTEQPVLWLAPSGGPDKPLVVILHSWSAPYTQHAGIPFAMWARENGWAVIAPEFRGKNKTPDAVGSELAVQDAADAIDYAVAQPGVDASRVYVVGYSGGGMMGLLLAGRHPDKVSAVSVWGPPHDLADFYDHARRNGLGYANDIWRACGGDPTSAGAAQEECKRRSPATYLDTARDQGVPVFVAQGISDQYVPRSVAAEVFNRLADPDDRLSAEEVALFDKGRVPDHLSITAETYFGNRNPAPVFARQSDQVLLVYFQSGHDMVYIASARWFASDPR